jgi:predicted nucleic acid-binding protein
VILMDSDVGVDVLRGVPGARQWFNGLPGDEQIVIPGHVAMELMHGLKDAQEAADYDRLSSSWCVVWLDPAGCRTAMATYRTICLANKIGVVDMLIAQVALLLNQPLYTFNVKHFRAVPGLRTVQPYVRA